MPTSSQKQNSLTLRTIARARHVPIGRTGKFSCIQFVSFLPDSTPKTSVQCTHIPPVWPSQAALQRLTHKICCSISQSLIMGPEDRKYSPVLSCGSGNPLRGKKASTNSHCSWGCVTQPGQRDLMSQSQSPASSTVCRWM